MIPRAALAKLIAITVVVLVILVTSKLVCESTCTRECDEVREDKDTNQQAYAYHEVKGVELDIKLEKTVYSLDEPIIVTVTLHNTNQLGILVQHLVLGGNIKFNITNSKGERVLESAIFDWDVHSFDLGSNETFTTTFSLQPMYKISEPDTYSMVGTYEFVHALWLVKAVSEETNFAVQQ